MYSWEGILAFWIVLPGSLPTESPEGCHYDTGKEACPCFAKRVLHEYFHGMGAFAVLQYCSSYSPSYVDRIWGIYRSYISGSYYNIPKAILHLLKGKIGIGFCEERFDLNA